MAVEDGFPLLKVIETSSPRPRTLFTIIHFTFVCIETVNSRRCGTQSPSESLFVLRSNHSARLEGYCQCCLAVFRPAPNVEWYICRDWKPTCLFFNVGSLLHHRPMSTKADEIWNAIPQLCQRCMVIQHQCNFRSPILPKRQHKTQSQDNATHQRPASRRLTLSLPKLPEMVH